MSYGGEIKKQAKVVTVAVHAARFTRSSGRAIMASSRRRMIAVAGTAAVGLTAALAGPAPSASAAITYPQPAITVAGGNTVIAVQTPKDGLYFFWNQYGTTSWQAEQVAASGTTFSAPTIAADGSSVIIAAQGANNSLMFYWQQDGATGWNPETVAGSGTTFSAPSIVANDGSANIVAEGPSNSLDFYWQQNNPTTWHPETVATGTRPSPRRPSRRTTAAPTWSRKGRTTAWTSTGSRTAQRPGTGRSWPATRRPSPRRPSPRTTAAPT